MHRKIPQRGRSGRGHTARALAALTVLALLVGACGGGAAKKAYKARPLDGLYNSAVSAMEQERWDDAAELFSEVERQHPYSEWATKAQLMGAYSRYQINEYDEAIIALDEYIQLHPSDPDVPYAHYLKALSYYEQISDVERDQGMTRRAMDTLKQIITRYPNSKYAQDAKLKLNLVYDHLGGKEMDIGRKYLKRREYLAAINRFKRVIDLYQTTTHVPEALHRLTESYLALGIKDEAKKTAAVLGYNYPGSTWYADSYVLLTGIDLRPEEYSDSWISRIWKSII